MSIIISFGGVPDGAFNLYEEAGFRFTTATNAPDAFEGGLSIADLGTGEYIFVRNTADTATVEKLDGGAFGVSSVDLDGFRWTGFTPAGEPIPGSSAVQINFIGYKSDGTTVSWSFSTDASSGFQTAVLPADFQGGLLAFQWYAEGGSGLTLFDNLTLQQNRPPVAEDYSGEGRAGETFIGQLAASDPDGQALVFQPVGDLPQGVTLDPDGRFYVEPLESDLDLPSGQSRVVTFQYAVSDGEAASEPQTVTFEIQGVTAPGKVIWGDNKSNTLTGDSGPDTIWGWNGEDTIAGDRGDDWLDGDNGKDSLSGGAGADTLWGGNGKDTLVGGAGDDKLFGGLGEDHFIFDQGSGRDVIFDFQSGHWEHHKHGWGWGGSGKRWEPGDLIQLSPATVGSFDELMQHAEQKWYGVEFDFGDGSSLTLMGVSLWSLNVDDFLFA